MYTCMICRFAVEPDDVQIRIGVHEGCICVRCYHRLSESVAPALRPELRAQIEAAWGPSDGK